MLAVNAIGGAEMAFTMLLMLAWVGVSLAILVYVLKLLGRLVASVEKLATAAERHASRGSATTEPPRPQ